MPDIPEGPVAAAQVELGMSVETVFEALLQQDRVTMVQNHKTFAFQYTTATHRHVVRRVASVHVQFFLLQLSLLDTLGHLVGTLKGIHRFWAKPLLPRIQCLERILPHVCFTYLIQF